MVQLYFVSPFFIVDNLKDSVSFYVDKLGFEIQYIGPDPDDDPFYAMVGRGNAYIMLKKITDDIKPIPNNTRHEWASWDAFISTSDPDTLFEEYRLRGVTFHDPLKNNSDGLRGFEVADADGYILYFGRPRPE